MIFQCGRRRRRLLFLPGGDSLWHKSRCAHAGILDVRSWSPTATATATAQRTAAATRPSPGTGCTWPQSGRMICGPTSSFRSHFAGSVPGMASGYRPQKWTTSGRTAETGQSSQIAAISRVFVIPATAARRWRKCGKSETLCVSAGDDNRRDAQAHRRGGRASAASPCTLPPGVKKVWPGAYMTAGGPSCEKFSPPVFPENTGARCVRL